MEISILPDEGMKGQASSIALSSALMLELGVIEGQQLQFQAGGREIFLRVQKSIHARNQEALVAPEVLDLFTSEKVDCRVPEITLGCDPEFFILWNGRRMNASAYLPFQGQIGCDGDLGELRPMYGRHEAQVISNLSGLINRIPGSLKRASFAAGAGYPETGRLFSYEAYSYLMGVAAGFHVHLGIPPELLNTRADLHRPTLNHLVQCLDWFVSVPMVPLETDNQRRLGRSTYGQPGDFRTTNVTLEYRTPGGFYLRSPALAGGLLGLSLLITEYFVGRVKEASQNFVHLREMSVADLQRLLPIPRPRTIQETLMSGSKDRAYRALPEIRETLTKFPNYSAHKDSIEEFLRVVDNKYVPVPNMLRNWERSK